MHHAEDSGPGTISNRGSAFFSEDQYVLNKTSTVYDAIFLSILWQQWLQCFPWHRCHKLVGHVVFQFNRPMSIFPFISDAIGQSSHFLYYRINLKVKKSVYQMPVLRNFKKLDESLTASLQQRSSCCTKSQVRTRSEQFIFEWKMQFRRIQFYWMTHLTTHYLE